jgi:hypothetical protein
MAFSPLSFLLGIGTGYVMPILTRNFRPLVVEATAMSMGLLEDVRRMVAEQIENLEDIAAEARARREELAAGVEPGNGDDGGDDTDQSSDDGSAPAHDVGGRRRAPRGRGRRE